MKLVVTITEEENEEISGDMKFEGESTDRVMASLILVAADLLQLEWETSGLEERYPFREALIDARTARK